MFNTPTVYCTFVGAAAEANITSGGDITNGGIYRTGKSRLFWLTFGVPKILPHFKRRMPPRCALDRKSVVCGHLIIGLIVGVLVLCSVRGYALRNMYAGGTFIVPRAIWMNAAITVTAGAFLLACRAVGDTHIEAGGLLITFIAVRSVMFITDNVYVMRLPFEVCLRNPKQTYQRTLDNLRLASYVRYMLTVMLEYFALSLLASRLYRFTRRMALFDCFRSVGSFVIMSAVGALLWYFVFIKIRVNYAYDGNASSAVRAAVALATVVLGACFVCCETRTTHDRRNISVRYRIGLFVGTLLLNALSWCLDDDVDAPTTSRILLIGIVCACIVSVMLTARRRKRLMGGAAGVLCLGIAGGVARA